MKTNAASERSLINTVLKIFALLQKWQRNEKKNKTQIFMNSWVGFIFS